MPKYRVPVINVTYSTAWLEVEAENAEKAAEVAWDIAQDYEDYEFDMTDSSLDVDYEQIELMVDDLGNAAQD